MLYFQRVAPLLAIGVLVAAAASAARAGTIIQAATAEATTNLNGDFPAPNPRNQDSGVVVDTVSASAMAQDSVSYTDSPDPDYTVSGSVSANVQTDRGQAIKLYESLSATGGAGSVAMTGFVTGTFSDVITITSVPNGQSGTLEFSDLLDGTMSGQGSLWTGAISLNLAITDYSTNQTYQVTEYHMKGTQGTSDSASGPASLTVALNDQIGIVAYETLTGSCVAGPTPSGIFNGNYENTTHIIITPLTPGLEFSSLSGSLYEAPAPEPASLSLLAAGGVILLARRRRVFS